MDFKERDERQKFYQSKPWRTIRQIKLYNEPLCEICFNEGILTPATEVHHKVDIKIDPSKRLEMNNLMSICKPHHSKITFEEIQGMFNKSKEIEILNRKWKI